jgi:hypothetical protein
MSGVQFGGVDGRLGEGLKEIDMAAMRRQIFSRVRCEWGAFWEHGRQGCDEG